MLGAPYQNYYLLCCSFVISLFLYFVILLFCYFVILLNFCRAHRWVDIGA